MPDSKKIGGKIVLEGEAEYKKALKEIKASQGELRSEMKLCSAEFANSQNSIDALRKKHEILSKQIDVQQDKVRVYSEAIESAKQQEEKSAEKVEELTKAYQKESEVLSRLKEDQTASADAVNAQQEKVQELEKKLSVAQQGYDKTAEKVKKYQTSMNYANAELAMMQSELQKTDGYMKEAENASDGCAKSIDEFGKETEDAAKSASVFGDVLKANLASEVIIKGVEALANAIKEASEAAIEVGSEFEASMSKVEAISGATSEEVERLGNKAKEMGAKTIYSASQSADAFSYMALAGWKTEDMLEGIEPILNLAAAANMDLAEASDIVTDYLTAFGLTAKDAGKFADQMAYTMSNSNTTVEQLGEAYKNCAATAESLGYSVEDVTAAIATMANAGVKGEEAGSGLNTIMTRLATNTKECTDELAKYGVRVYTAEGQMNSLSSILEGMAGIWGTLTDEEQANLAKTIAGTNQFSKLQTVLTGLSESAKESGKSFSDYSEALTSCDGAAKDMADTMQNNLKGDVTILQSALEGLGIVSYDVFNDSMRKSVQSATDAVTRLTKSVESGKLNVSLNRLGKSLEDFTDEAIDLGEDALPVLIDGLSWILDHADIIASGIAGIAAANLQMKVVAPAVGTVTTALGALKDMSEGVKITQLGVNAAMKANPVWLLISGITALTVAVGAYCIMNQDALRGLNDVEKKTKDLVEANRQLLDSYNNTSENRKNEIEALSIETTHAQELADRLIDLQKKIRLTKEEQSEQNRIIAELNQIYPELNLSLDEYGELTDSATKSLYENIDAMKAQMQATQAQEQMQEVLEEIIELEEAKVELEQQLQAQQEDTAAALEAENEALNNQLLLFSTGGAGMQPYIQAAGNAREQQADLEEQLASTNETIDSLYAEYDNLCAALGGYEEAASSASDKTGELGDAASGAASDMQGMSDAVKEACDTMINELTDTISGQMSIFEEFKQEAGLTTDEILNNMQSQIDGVSNWADNLEELAERGIDKGLLSHLANLGPDGAAYVQTFVNMTQEQLERAGELYTEYLSIPSETAEKIAESYFDAGAGAAAGFKEGIEGEAEEAVETAGRVAHDTLDKMRDVLDEHSPSKETEEIGRNEIIGLENGILDEEDPLMLVIQNMAEEMLHTIRIELSYDELVKIGQQIPAGLAQGINSGKSNVINAAVDMARAAIQAAEQELDIHSPSKKFDWMGEMSGEGYINGLERSMRDIDAVVQKCMPETSIPQQNNTYISNEGGKRYEIQQEINIYSPAEDLLETEMAFKRAMQEAGSQW